MINTRINAACGISTSVNDNEIKLIVAGGSSVGNSSEVFIVDKVYSTKNRFKWEKGPDLPREFIMGGSLYDKEKGEWILVGGTDIHGMKQYSDIIRYNKDTNKFEFLPAKLKVGRYGFGALLAQVSDKC